LTSLLATAVLSASLSGCYFTDNLMKKAGAPLSEDHVESMVKRLAAELDVKSNLSRSSGQVTALRLKALFPNFDTDKYILGKSTDAAVNATAAYFTEDDRPSGALASLALRNTITGPCKDPTNKVFQTSGILMSGESLPTDAIVRDAFAAARNVWLYPYTAASKEVGVLVDTYKSTIAGGGADAEGHQAMCMIAILAPQFWLGNAGQFDYVRKMALDLARRLPRFSDYEAIMNGKVTVANMVSGIQSEAGYYSTVKDWHTIWLGFQSQASNYKRGYNYFGGYGGPTGIAGGLGTIIKGRVTLLNGSQADVRVGNYARYYRENCNPVEQAFDPITSKVIWEQWNPVNSTWETLVTQQKNPDGTWAEIKGQITLADGSKKSIGLADITTPNYDGDKALTVPQVPAGLPANAYPANGIYSTNKVTPPSALVGTPLEMNTSINLRVRRFGSDGVEQNGMSKVRLYWSGDSMYTCNSISRIIETCSFRPDPNIASNRYNVNGYGGYGWPFAINLTGWNAAQKYPDVDYLGFGIEEISAYNGNVLDNFSCGVPSTAELNKGGPSFNELVAYPKAAPYSDLVVNNQFSPDVSTSPNYIASDEGTAWAQISEDMDNEPYYLIDDLIRQDKDYRLLITAPYTLGRKPLEFYYRTQALWLPAYPEGNYSKPGDPGFFTSSVGVIDPTKFGTLPKSWLRSSFGSYAGYGGTLAATYTYPVNGQLTLQYVTPRPMSGILTQAAFINPMRPKVRSLASRYFTRLMCMDPSAFTPDKAQEAVQVAHMPKIDQDVYKYYTDLKKSGIDPQTDDKYNKMVSHVDPQKGCFACHINLDPLAHALSAAFANSNSDVEYDPRNFSIGEMLGPGESPVWGIQGSSEPGVASEGAIFGQKVTGVRELGRVLADSDVFAACVVQKAFENIFGRTPNFDDQIFMTNIVSDFKTNYSYNSMVRKLVMSPMYLRKP
jgi:hypothetical protein